MPTVQTESKVTPQIAAEHGLTPDEYARIQKILGRDPNLTELGIFSVMWSEHCSYKSSRVHLKRLPTRGTHVVQGPGENAGVVDIGDGLVAVFKIESHNHPSFVEPFQGAATGVGGILRDIFTMGARPIAVLDSLRFGPIDRGAGGGDATRRRDRAQPAHSRRRDSRHRVLRKLFRRADRRRRSGRSSRAIRIIRWSTRSRSASPPRRAFLRARQRRRQSRDLRRRENGPRRNSRRVAARLRGIQRRIAAETAQRAGGRPVHGKAAARSVPRSDAHRRDRRDSGHGRGGADELELGDGVARRVGHRDRSRARAAARNRT